MPQQLVAYDIDGEAFDLLVVSPDEPGPHPTVMICHAWGGRDAFVQERAEALVELGYAAVGVDLYGVGKRGSDKGSSAALMNALVGEPPKLHARLRRAVEETAKLELVDTERMASIGYCFGGLCSLLLARLGLPLRGSVSFHGLLKLGARLETKPQARMLVLHGQDDPMVPPADVAAFAEEMKRVDADWQLHAYPQVVHAFTNPNAADPDFGTVYDADADERSWIAMQRFLGDVFG